MKSYTKISKLYNLELLTEVEIYKLVRSGAMKKFPQNFWDCDESDEYAPEIIRFLITDVLNWNDEDLKCKLRKSTFRDNALAGMLAIKYDDSPFKAICAAFPEKEFIPFQFHETPNKYWQGDEGKENAIKAIKWLFEEELHWCDEDIKNKLSQEVFTKHNLRGMLKRAFGCDMFLALDAAYPGKFKRWELGLHVKNEYWTKEEGILAVKWLIEEKLGWTDEDIIEKYKKDIFKEYNLYGMIQRCFSASPFEALNAAYPDRFKPWELNNVGRNFWKCQENCIAATKWLVEEKLKLSQDKYPKLTKMDFKKHGLHTLVENHSVDELLRNSFPENYRR